MVFSVLAPCTCCINPQTYCWLRETLGLEDCIRTLSRWVTVGGGNFNSAVGQREGGSGEKNYNNKNAGLRIPQQCIKRHKKQTTRANNVF